MTAILKPIVFVLVALGAGGLGAWAQSELECSRSLVLKAECGS
jgi:hypothetical protein